MLYPPKLMPGNGVRIIAPARSLGMDWIPPELISSATQRLTDLGVQVSFGKHVFEVDAFESSSIQSRLEDIHDALSDSNIHALLTCIGGFNSNQLLKYLDYDLIKKHPKIICGFSDITALSNAIYAKTGVVGYSGPHFLAFGMQQGFAYTLDYWKRCLRSNEAYSIDPSPHWSDEKRMINQDNRIFYDNGGRRTIQPGQATGTILGGNLGTFALLQGTEFFPSLEGAILFLEEDYEMHPRMFDRNLQSLIQQPGFSHVRGLVIGRFQQAAHMTPQLLTQIINSKKELSHLPVLANVDFGHTTPYITFPLGGTVSLDLSGGASTLHIIQH